MAELYVPNLNPPPPPTISLTSSGGGLSGAGTPDASLTADLGIHYWDYVNKIDYVMDLVGGVNKWIQFV